MSTTKSGLMLKFPTILTFYLKIDKFTYKVKYDWFCVCRGAALFEDGAKTPTDVRCFFARCLQLSVWGLSAGYFWEVSCEAEQRCRLHVRTF